MSDDLQRIIGEILARLSAVERLSARNEKWFIAIGMSAVGLVAAAVVKQLGLF